MKPDDGSGHLQRPRRIRWVTLTLGVLLLAQGLGKLIDGASIS